MNLPRNFVKLYEIHTSRNNFKSDCLNQIIHVWGCRYYIIISLLDAVRESSLKFWPFSRNFVHKICIYFLHSETENFYNDDKKFSCTIQENFVNRFVILTFSQKFNFKDKNIPYTQINRKQKFKLQLLYKIFSANFKNVFTFV